MDYAVVLLTQGWLPALWMIAILDLNNLLFVLPEVQALGWEHFVSNWDLEIFIGDHAISIKIKFVEYFLKVFFWNFHTPEIELVSQFFLWDFASFLYVQVLESFSESFPLEFDFLEDLVLNISFH